MNDVFSKKLQREFFHKSATFCRYSIITMCEAVLVRGKRENKTLKLNSCAKKSIIAEMVTIDEKAR